MSAPIPLTVDDAVAATSSLIDDRARDRIVVTGSDASSYLHSQLAQDVAGMSVGDRRWSLLLDPTGKVDALLRVERVADDRFELDTDAGFGDAAATRLRRFMIRVDVGIETVEAAADAPDDEHESRRITAGWPRMGAEIEPGQTIPATTGVVPLAVDFTKGCYPGQELVERMDSRGADAPRRLRVIDAVPGQAPGDPIVVDGAEVGIVTSVAPTGSPAIGMVRRGVEIGRGPAHLGD